MSAIVHTAVSSPIGTLHLWGDGDALCGLLFDDWRHGGGPPANAREDGQAFRAAREQLAAYFAGELRQFSLALAPQGTAFQQQVWRALLEVPYGRTESYGGLARRIERPNAFRAVGLANGRNPIAVVVPCHRVIGADGSLTGYGGGMKRKAWLLAHESRHSPADQRRLPGL